MSTTNNAFPFMTKKQVAEKIATDPDFAQMCIGILQLRTELKSEGGAGFMASQREKGKELATKIVEGVQLSAEEVEQCVSLASKYTRQIALHLREDAKAGSPELAEKAAIFGC